jgi:hypothetical protein
MSRIHWVSRGTGTPRDKDEVNKREIHEYDGRAHDPDTMVTILTPKPTLKVEPLVRAPSTIASSVGGNLFYAIFLLFIMNRESES